MRDNISTVSMERFDGIPVAIHNAVIYENHSKVTVGETTYNGFYVSYNNYDVATYGDVTTALVLGQMQKFYILNGNHTEAYKSLWNDGFEKCMEYFITNISEINKYSDLP